MASFTWGTSIHTTPAGTPRPRLRHHHLPSPSSQQQQPPCPPASRPRRLSTTSAISIYTSRTSPLHLHLGIVTSRRPMTNWVLAAGGRSEVEAQQQDGSPNVKVAAALPTDRMLVFVPPHPLVKHWISVLRNKETPSAIFRTAMTELGRILIYEASRDWLPMISGEIDTPVGVAPVEFIDPREPVLVIPILRAGLALAEHAPLVLPATKTYHLGMRRDEETLLPSTYLNNLPEKLPEGSRVLVVDPMLATGGTMVAALDLLKDRGVGNKQIKIVSAVASPPALQKLGEKFPGVHVYAGIIDPVVDDKGWIIPGLGDAGDRSFGT